MACHCVRFASFCAGGATHKGTPRHCGACSTICRLCIRMSSSTPTPARAPPDPEPPPDPPPEPLPRPPPGQSPVPSSGAQPNPPQALQPGLSSGLPASVSQCSPLDRPQSAAPHPMPAPRAQLNAGRSTALPEPISRTSPDISHEGGASERQPLRESQGDSREGDFEQQARAIGELVPPIRDNPPLYSPAPRSRAKADRSTSDSPLLGPPTTPLEHSDEDALLAAILPIANLRGYDIASLQVVPRPNHPSRSQSASPARSRNVTAVLQSYRPRVVSVPSPQHQSRISVVHGSPFGTSDGTPPAGTSSFPRQRPQGSPMETPGDSPAVPGEPASGRLDDDRENFATPAAQRHRRPSPFASPPSVLSTPKRRASVPSLTSPWSPPHPVLPPVDASGGTPSKRRRSDPTLQPPAGPLLTPADQFWGTVLTPLREPATMPQASILRGSSSPNIAFRPQPQGGESAQSPTTFSPRGTALQSGAYQRAAQQLRSRFARSPGISVGFVGEDTPSSDPSTIPEQAAQRDQGPSTLRLPPARSLPRFSPSTSNVVPGEAGTRHLEEAPRMTVAPDLGGSSGTGERAGPFPRQAPRLRPDVTYDRGLPIENALNRHVRGLVQSPHVQGANPYGGEAGQQEADYVLPPSIDRVPPVLSSATPTAAPAQYQAPHAGSSPRISSISPHSVGIGAAPGPAASGAGPSGQQFACDQCNQRFGRRSDRNRHIRVVHEKQRPFACPTCHAAFGERSNMLKHVRMVHENIRKFQCPHCSQSFGQRGNCDTHIRAVHERSKNPRYVCPYCRLAFTKPAHVRDHACEARRRGVQSQADLQEGGQPQAQANPPPVGSSALLRSSSAPLEEGVQGRPLRAPSTVYPPNTAVHLGQPQNPSWQPAPARYPLDRPGAQTAHPAIPSHGPAELPAVSSSSARPRPGPVEDITGTVQRDAPGLPQNPASSGDYPLTPTTWATGHDSARSLAGTAAPFASRDTGATHRSPQGASSSTGIPSQALTFGVQEDPSMQRRDPHGIGASAPTAPTTSTVDHGPRVANVRPNSSRG